MKRTRGESPNTNGSGFHFADAGASPKEAAPEVEKALLSAGYEILASKTRGDWHAFAARRL